MEELPVSSRTHKTQSRVTPSSASISLPSIHKDLIAAKELVYDQCGFKYTLPLAEAESAEYGAYNFELNELSIKFRVAKITPTKTGQFVTLWKRSENGPIQPFDIDDGIDVFIISTRKGEHFGQFIFSKSVMHEKGIISSASKEGKRATRVYPPWDLVTNQQAKKTQQWQLKYFLEIPEDKPVDLIRAEKLLRL